MCTDARSLPAVPNARADAWVNLAAILVFGYLAVSRTFAYIGIPFWKAYIGEAALVLFVGLCPAFRKGCWIRTTATQPLLKPLWFCYALFFAYGVIQVLHGLEEGNPPLVALRDLAFNYYPVYFVLGLWAGAQRADVLSKVMRAFAWFNAPYGLLYLFWLNRIEWFVPGISDDVAPVSIFPQPCFSFVALLGLMVLEKSVRRAWYLILLNGFVLLGMQFRTEWLAVIVGALTWLLTTREIRKGLQVAAIMVSLLASMYVTDFSIPTPEGRAQEDVSGRQLASRVVAPFQADVGNTDTAAGFGGVDPQEATFVWRTVWWISIWYSVHERWTTAIWGFGYGFPLSDLVPYLRNVFLRTPHNFFFYALGYTGWIGVILFFLVQWQVLRLLWKMYRKTEYVFGLVYWMAMMTYGMFFPLGETPYGAIPFYIVIGLTLGRFVFTYPPKDYSALTRS